MSPKWLIAILIILLCDNLVLSQSISKNKMFPISLASYDSLWTESKRNIEFRKQGKIGFIYPYNLPDSNKEAIALFRTYNTPINNGFAVIEVDNTLKDLKTLNGRVKFSGSDIDQAQDTLIIATYYSKTKDSSLIKSLNIGQVPKIADVLKISDPKAQFEYFHINLSENNNNEEQKYLIIQFIIKSGSDDDFYYGKSNAVIDGLYFTNSQI